VTGNNDADAVISALGSQEFPG